MRWRRNLIFLLDFVVKGKLIINHTNFFSHRFSGCYTFHSNTLCSAMLRYAMLCTSITVFCSDDRKVRLARTRLQWKSIPTFCKEEKRRFNFKQCYTLKYWRKWKILFTFSLHASFEINVKLNKWLVAILLHPFSSPLHWIHTHTHTIFYPRISHPYNEEWKKK